MPTTINKKRSARVARKGAEARSDRPSPVRSSRKGASPDEAVAPSIHTLRLKPKNGVDVFFELKGTMQDRCRNPEVFLKDVAGAYRNLYKRLKGEDIGDVRRMGKDAIWMIIKSLEVSLLPSGWGFNFDSNEERFIHMKGEAYCITLYHTCDFPTQWHVFPLKPVIKLLEKKHPAMLELFLSFIKSFVCTTKVDLWFTGFMGSEMERFEEMVMDWENHWEEEKDFEKASKLFHSYSQGEIKQWERRIWSAPIKTADELLASLSIIEYPKKVADMIRKGCEVMRPEFNVGMYRYMPMAEYDQPDFYLDYDSQCNFIWDFDEFTSIFETTIDSQANEGGVQEPVYSVTVTSRTAHIELLEMNEAIRWPQQLSDFFQYSNALR